MVQKIRPSSSPMLMPFRQTIHRTPLLLLAMCLSICATGCTMMTVSELPFAKKKEPEFLTPRQMVPVWSDTVLHQSGEPATRGFGGRLMFYGQDKHKPIRVSGSLIVYAWDDSKGSMERAPDRKYVFPSDSLQSHYSQSRLGHSYSFWVPWDAAGGTLQHMTLICRFLSDDGTELTADPAHVVLQGPSESSPFPNESKYSSSPSDSPPKEGFSATRQRKTITNGIQQAGYESDEAFQDAPRQPAVRRAHPGLQTSEIDLTRGFYERNMQRPQSVRQPSDLSAVDAQDLFETSSPPEPALNSPRTQSSGQTSSPSASAASADEGKSAAEPDPQSTRFAQFESRVRAARTARSSGDHVRKEPLRATWLNGLPETPRSSRNATE